MDSQPNKRRRSLWFVCLRRDPNRQRWHNLLHEIVGPSGDRVRSLLPTGRLLFGRVGVQSGFYCHWPANGLHRVIQI